MRTADSRWAAVLVGTLRPLAIIVGSTFAVHRLALRLRDRLHDGLPGTEGAFTDRSFVGRLGDALTPDSGVVDATGRTALLAAGATVAGLALGWGWAAAHHRLSHKSTAADRPVSGLWTGLALALTVPGLTWLPLEHWAVGQGLVPDGPLPSLASGSAGYRSMAFWSFLIGLAIAPTVAAARSGGRSWTAVGAVGHPALAPLAGRPSSPPLWRVGIPVLTFGITLAVAEVVSGNGGLVDRFVAAVGDGRPDDLLDLATPLIVASALLATLADLGAAVLRRVERPRVPSAERAGSWRRPAALAVGLGGLVAAATVAGALAGPATETVDRALVGPELGGPWLGTDDVGRSIAGRTGAALGATIVASAIPAAIATMVGAGLAFFRRPRGATVGAVFGWLLDLFSWPAALVVPLAIWPVDAEGLAVLDSVAVQVTALLLVPAATRLVVRPVATRSRRITRLAATLCLLTAGALAIQLFASFVVPGGETPWPGLGQLIAGGMDTYGASPWPALIPLAAAAAAGTALYWAADALIRLGDHTVIEEADDPGIGWSSAFPDRVVLAARPDAAAGEPTAIDREPEPPRVTLADDTAPGPTGPDPTITLDGPVDATAEPPPAEGSGPVEAPQADEGDDEDTDAVDIRDDISVASAVDVPPPDDQTTIEDEASQTIELRPSDLRRAGVRPDEP